MRPGASLPFWYTICISLPKKLLPNSLGADWQQLILRRAVDEVRTRDPQLGKLMLYQLSYYRISFTSAKIKPFAEFCKKIAV
jgi:hypothetical protein